MKKQVTLHIDIDTEIIGSSEFRESRLRDGLEIVIRKDEANGDEETHADFVFCLTHELGHAVGKIMGLPGFTQDFRTVNHVASNKTINQSIVASEYEAWDVAEMILKFDAHRKKYLNSYESTYGKIERNKFDEKRFYQEIA